MNEYLGKKWAVIDGDDIVVEAETKREVEHAKRVQDLDGEIVALPKPHISFFV